MHAQAQSQSVPFSKQEGTGPCHHSVCMLRANRHWKNVKEWGNRADLTAKGNGSAVTELKGTGFGPDVRRKDVTSTTAYIIVDLFVERRGR